MDSTDFASSLVIVCATVLVSLIAMVHVAVFPYATARTLAWWALPVMAAPIAGPVSWMVYATVTTVRARRAITALTNLSR